VNCDAICDLLRWGAFDRAVMRLLARVPVLSPVMVLGWMTVRCRPFSPVALIGAWLRSPLTRRRSRAALERELAESAGPPAAGIGSADAAIRGSAPPVAPRDQGQSAAVRA
jgi:hypothetical protein